MKYLWIALAAGGLVAGCGVENKTENPQQVAESAAPSVMLNTQVSAPVAKKVPHEMTAHGVTRNDNYYWMRDDSRTDEEILSHLEQENSYVETVLVRRTTQPFPFSTMVTGTTPATQVKMSILFI